MGSSGIGDFLVDQTGGNEVSKYGGLVARARQEETKAAYNAYEKNIGEATVAGLSSLDRDIANQEKNLARQEKLISSIDPTIMEASQQALKLLRGEQSSTLNPLQNQRAQQRQKLLNSLREQLGPGAETSSAGISALSKFDTETSNIMAGAQQNALSQLGNTAGQFNSTRPDMFREIMGLSGFGQQQYGLRSNQAQGLFNARQGLAQTAGAQYTEGLLYAQNRQAHLNALHESGMAIGESWATMGRGGGNTKVKNDADTGGTGGGSSGGGGGGGYLGFGGKF